MNITYRIYTGADFSEHDSYEEAQSMFAGHENQGRSCRMYVRKKLPRVTRPEWQLLKGCLARATTQPHGG